MTNTNNIQNNETVFLDTTFLAAVFIKEHPDNKKAVKLLAVLLTKGCDMRTSLLCIYELLGVVKKVNDNLNGNKPLFRKINTVLRKIKLKILFEELNFSYKQIFPQLQAAINKLQGSGFVTYLNLESGHITGALQAVDSYGSAPGDAFHHAVILADNINSVVTENYKDFLPAGLNVIRI